VGNSLTDAENAALVLWTRSDHSHGNFMEAVREAVARTERRFEQSEDHRIACLRDELAAIRDLAYRGSGDGAADALKAIHQRACRALNEEK
jgi:hypothetical protein